MADCIIIGAVTGTPTSIIVTDTNAAGTAVLNPAGILLVDATSAAAGSFMLSGTNVVNTAQGPAIVKGFVQYQLAFDPVTNNFTLVGAPSAALQEVGSLVSASANLWHDTTGGWGERMTDLRQTMAANRDGTVPVPAQGGAGGYSFWGKTFYSQLNRDQTRAATVGGVATTYDTSYKQKTGGLQLGFDTVSQGPNGNAFVTGGTLGYNQSRLTFDADASKATNSVWNLGAYASYIMGPAYVDLLVKTDYGKIKLDVPNAATMDDTGAASLGAQLTAGQRFDVASLQFKPSISLAYVRSTLETITAPSGQFDFESGNSFRATAGLRVSKSWNLGMTTLQPFVFGGVGHEFDGKNTMNVISGTTTLAIDDKPIETFGLASIGLNLSGRGGFSGFVKVDGFFADGAKGGALRLGFRFTE